MPPVGAVDRAEVHAPAGLGSVARTPDTLSPGPTCAAADSATLDLVGQRHVTYNRRHAVRRRTKLFAPLRPSYDRGVGAALSFGKTRSGGDSSSHARPATAATCSTDRTGLVAAELLRRGHRVTGVDQSAEMLRRARQRFGDRVELVEASAEAMPFADATFDHLTVTSTFRYVDDPGRDSRRASPA